jgi:PIN domain nuclease of toxin-antitoxin system
MVDAPSRLSERERLVLTSSAVDLYVSAVAIWEMRLKWSAVHPSGERKSPHDPEDVLAALEDQDFVYLPPALSHAARPLQIPIPHKEPFDELLLVQAQEEGLRLLTTDGKLVDHPLALTA